MHQIFSAPSSLPVMPCHVVCCFCPSATHSATRPHHCLVARAAVCRVNACSPVVELTAPASIPSAIAAACPSLRLPVRSHCGALVHYAPSDHAQPCCCYSSNQSVTRVRLTVILRPSSSTVVVRLPSPHLSAIAAFMSFGRS